MAPLDNLTRTSLQDRISSRLTLGREFLLHHISTPPTKCEPLFAALPGRKPERTYCETHFLTLSAPSPTGARLLFAVEVLIVTTKRLTTLFVSKADSTGCIASLGLQSGGGGSIIRNVASEFLSWLVQERKRAGVRCMISLFARAQGQYLFPRSVENGGKHVLDDRQLIRWWCKTLDVVLRGSKHQDSRQGYVIVPGFDKAETAAFFPSTWRQDPVDERKWQYGHPLNAIAMNEAAPPRCLVPRFPDDPKARYLYELDEELPDSQGSSLDTSPSKKGNGMWKSIKTLSQFWEMMAFRQECSSGRMVGFIWLVFTPDELHEQFDDDSQSVYSSQSSISPGVSDIPTTGRIRLDGGGRKKILSGPIVPRAPKIKKASSNTSDASIPESSAYWRWPLNSRSQVVIPKPAYDRIHDLLLKLDFCDDEATAQSTKKWLEEAKSVLPQTEQWGQRVTGSLPVVGGGASEPGTTASGASQQPRDLTGTMVRKKRKTTEEPQGQAGHAPPQQGSGAPAVNVLGAGMIRKKPKVNN